MLLARCVTGAIVDSELNSAPDTENPRRRRIVTHLHAGTEGDEPGRESVDAAGSVRISWAAQGWAERVVLPASSRHHNRYIAPDNPITTNADYPLEHADRTAPWSRIAALARKFVRAIRAALMS
jgi:hypothetical protein